MVTVRFYGDLKQFGTTFKLDAVSVPEALRALMLQIKGLREHIEKGHYKVKADGKHLTADTLETNLNSTLHITPVVAGAGKNGGIMQIIVGVVMIVAAFYTGGATAAAYFTAGAGMVMGGIAQLLTKLPTMEPMKASDDLKSSSFSSLANMAAQGSPVPIIYGQMMVGSRVLSQGVRSIFTGQELPQEGTGPKNIFEVLKERRTTIKPVSNIDGARFDSTNTKVMNRNYTVRFEKE